MNINKTLIQKIPSLNDSWAVQIDTITFKKGVIEVVLRPQTTPYYNFPIQFHLYCVFAESQSTIDSDILYVINHTLIYHPAIQSLKLVDESVWKKEPTISNQNQNRKAWNVISNLCTMLKHPHNYLWSDYNTRSSNRSLISSAELTLLSDIESSLTGHSLDFVRYHSFRSVEHNNNQILIDKVLDLSYFWKKILLLSEHRGLIRQTCKKIASHCHPVLSNTHPMVLVQHPSICYYIRNNYTSREIRVIMNKFYFWLMKNDKSFEELFPQTPIVAPDVLKCFRQESTEVNLQNQEISDFIQSVATFTNAKYQGQKTTKESNLNSNSNCFSDRFMSSHQHTATEIKIKNYIETIPTIHHIDNMANCTYLRLPYYSNSFDYLRIPNNSLFCIVPLLNDNDHNYALGKPILHNHEDRFHIWESATSLGNHMSKNISGFRPATHEEIVAFFKTHTKLFQQCFESFKTTKLQTAEQKSESENFSKFSDPIISSSFHSTITFPYHSPYVSYDAIPVRDLSIKSSTWRTSDFDSSSEEDSPHLSQYLSSGGGVIKSEIHPVSVEIKKMLRSSDFDSVPESTSPKDEIQPVPVLQTQHLSKILQTLETKSNILKAYNPVPVVTTPDTTLPSLEYDETTASRMEEVE